LILDEPAILGHEWANYVEQQLKRFGVIISDADWTRKNHRSFQEFFNAMILPELSAATQWGLSTTRLSGWRDLFANYPPQQLVLCVRDIRDVILSHVDVALHLGVPIDGAFIEHRTVTSAAEMIALTQQPHTLLRYEELATVGGMRRLSESLGLDLTGNFDAPTPLKAGPPNRHLLEHRTELVQFVERVWRRCETYCQAFGYPTADTAGQSRVA